MTYSQRKDIKIARAKKNYEKIQKYEKMAKGLVTSKSGKIYLLSHTFFHCIIVNWNMTKQCKQQKENRYFFQEIKIGKHIGENIGENILAQNINAYQALTKPNLTKPNLTEHNIS